MPPALAATAAFATQVFVGFARTYYPKSVFGTPAVAWGCTSTRG